MKKWSLIILFLIPLGVHAQNITTYAGKGISAISGDGGLADTANIGAPLGLNFDHFGNLLICHISCVRKVDKLTTIITTIAGSDTASSLGHGGDGGPATRALIVTPNDICVDAAGNYYIADGWYSEIRKVTIATGIIDTFAGSRLVGNTGDGGPAKKAKLGNLNNICFDITQSYLYICDAGYYRVRRVNMLTDTITAFAGTGVKGFSGDGGPAINAQFGQVCGLRIDQTGNFYIGDSSNARIRKIDAVTGIVTTIAGNGTIGFSGDGGPATNAMISTAGCICFDKCGNLYFSDHDNNRIRRIDMTTGIINTIAGNGTAGFSGDGGPALSAALNGPSGLAIDSSGNIYIGDYYNCRVRKMTFAPPFVSLPVSSADTVCAGSPVTLYAATALAGSAPSFQWFVNGALAATTGTGSYTYTPVIGDTVYCILTSSSGCVGTATVVSNTVHIAAPPSVGITVFPSHSDTVCVGTPVTYTAAVSGSSTFSYKWYKNGTVVSTVGNTYTYTPADGDSIRCLFYGTAICSGNADTVNSNTVNMVVTPLPAVAISPGPNDTVCAGTPVTYTATATGSGTFSYNWYINGAVVSTGGNTYTYTPADGDSVRCLFYGTYLCSGLPDTVSSNTINMVVNPLPAVSITGSIGAGVCPGTLVTYTATATGSSTFAYTWYVNGAPVSTTGSTYSYTPANGDSVRCVFAGTGTGACAGQLDTVSSNTINMVVNPLPTITISPSPNDTVCAGTQVTYTATATGSSTFSYKWYKNGVVVSTSGSAYTYTPANRDSIRCLFYGTNICDGNADTVNSNTVNMVVTNLTIPTISIGGIASTPIGSMVTITATVTNAGGSYNIKWFNNGVLFSTTTAPTVTTSYIKAAGTDNITATVIPAIIRTVPGCYDSTTSVVHTIAATAGVNTITSERLHIYPNPANDVIHIDGVHNTSSSFGAGRGEVYYKLLDIVGAILQQGNLTEGDNSISIQSLPVGMYILKVTNNEGEKIITKIIKQ